MWQNLDTVLSILSNCSIKLLMCSRPWLCSSSGETRPSSSPRNSANLLEALQPTGGSRDPRNYAENMLVGQYLLELKWGMKPSQFRNFKKKDAAKPGVSEMKLRVAAVTAKIAASEETNNSKKSSSPTHINEVEPHVADELMDNYDKAVFALPSKVYRYSAVCNLVRCNCKTITLLNSCEFILHTMHYTFSKCYRFDLDLEL